MKNHPTGSIEIRDELLSLLPPPSEIVGAASVHDLLGGVRIAVNVRGSVSTTFAVQRRRALTQDEATAVAEALRPFVLRHVRSSETPLLDRRRKLPLPTGKRDVEFTVLTGEACDALRVWLEIEPVDQTLVGATKGGQP